jgi:uncharacterized protein YecT (DUF1311 family)
MKSLLLYTMLALLAAIVQAQDAEQPCPVSPQTQTEITACSGSDLATADSELNATYHRVLEKYSKDPERIARITKAERMWIIFRDAELDSLMPMNSKSQSEVVDFCRATLQTKLIRARIVQLKALLTPEEGDICAARRR